ncbi:hypothetical protein AAU61_03370 [Desulfocarbo indianensis]|nr:hypothetical protein AAU61_03370 [Desulfocarbo indianensis]
MLCTAFHKNAVRLAACTLLFASPVAAQELVNGQPAEVAITSPEGGYAAAAITVPQGAMGLVVDLHAAPDGPALSLGVNFGSAPDPGDPGSWECAQSGAGGLACQYATPQAGTYYMVVTSQSPAGGILTATYALAGQPENSAWQQDALAAGQAKTYAITLPEGTNLFKANLHTSLGSAALFTKAGRPPAETDYDCSAFSQNGNARCIHHFPQGGIWYAIVIAREDSLVHVQLHYTRNQEGEQNGDLDRDRDRDQINKPEKDKMQ